MNNYYRFVDKVLKGTRSGDIKWHIASLDAKLSNFAQSYSVQRGNNYLTLEVICDDKTSEIHHMLSICDYTFVKLKVFSGAMIDELYDLVRHQMYDIDGIMNNFVAGIV